jgi:glutathione synthase/RimK-type ligase-like ATP-grasp enzyme
MIIFYGYGDDEALVAAARTAAERGLDHLLVDQRLAFAHDLLLEVGADGVAGFLDVAGQRIALAEVSAIYARPLATPPAGDLWERERSDAFHTTLIEWLDVADCLVVNRPCAMNSNASKPFQAQEIAAAGFAIPDTLITSDPAAAMAFWEKHGEVVFKSTSGIRSIVRRLDSRSAPQLDRLRDLPTQFQECVEGVDIRVHVVGDRVFACEILSDAVDYRYARRDGLTAQLTPVDIDDELRERSIEIARRLELPFAGIDLRRRRDGKYVCFEVNPMPGYSYFQSETGQEISAALVALLDHEAGDRWSASSQTAPRSRARSARGGRTPTSATSTSSR